MIETRREQDKAAEGVKDEEAAEKLVREVKGIVGQLEIMDVRVARGAEADPDLIRAKPRRNVWEA